MPDQPLVSISAISYNTARYIIETLESIRMQTYPNIELVIVDDCSTDNSVELITDWLKTCDRPYKFIRHETNKGTCATYNSGLYASSGTYFTVIDTDDVMLPEKTEKQVQILSDTGPKIAAVYSNAYVMDDTGNPVEGLFIARHRRFSELPSGMIFHQLLEGNYIPCMTMLVKRAVFDDIGGYDESLAYEDFDMWLRIARKYEILYSDYVSCRYRIRPGSLSFTIRNWDYSNARIFLKHADVPLPLGWLNDIAFHAYSVGDQITMPLIGELAKKTHGRVLMAIFLVWKFRIPVEIANAFVDRVREHLAQGLSPLIANSDDEDLHIFLTEIFYSIPAELFKKLAADAYVTENTEALGLVNALADKIDSRYLKTAFLLWRFKVAPDKGLAILAGVQGNILHDEPVETVSPDDRDLSIFIDDILPSIHPPLLRKLALEGYVEHIDDTMSLLNKLANKNGDLYLKTACAMKKYAIPPGLGALILSQAEEYMPGAPQGIPSPSGNDDKVLSNEVIPVLPLPVTKKLILYAYTKGDEPIMQAIYDWASATNDRYGATAFLLWHFKISPATGEEILRKTEEAITAGMSDKIYASNKIKDRGIEVFLKEVISIISPDLQKKLASEAYYNNNPAFIPVIKELAKETKNRYFKAIVLLWKFKVNAYTGKIILERVNGYCNAKLNNQYIDLCIYKDIYGAFKTGNTALIKSK